MQLVVQDDNIPAQSILRIYLRRRNQLTRGFFKGLFAPPLSYQLVKDALVAGITYATVTLGHSGYVAGATRVGFSQSEIAVETLPTCVELVAPRTALELFLRNHAVVLASSVVVWIDGVSVVSS